MKQLHDVGIYIYLPFNIVISGSSNTGKSEWVLKLIENASTMISPPVDLIIYCYKEFQARFKRVKGVIFHEGFDKSLVSKEKLQNRSVLSNKANGLIDVYAWTHQNLNADTS